MRRSVHGGDCVVLSGQRKPTLYSDALAELRAAQKATLTLSLTLTLTLTRTLTPSSAQRRRCKRPTLTQPEP